MRFMKSLAAYWAAIVPAPGAGRLALLGNAVKLARARRRYGIGPADFALYGMADRPDSEWLEYVNEPEFKNLARSLSDLESRRLAHDKLRFHEHCRTHGIRTVAVLGIVGGDGSGDAFVPHLEADGVASLLEEHGQLFFKRLDRSYGVGAFRARWQDGQVAFNDRTGSVADLVAHCRGHGRGYIVQELIRMHPAVQAIMAQGVGTVRVMTCRLPPPFRIIGAYLRITVGSNVTDNFVYGTSGNLSAGIDVETGRLTNCFGARHRGSLQMAEVDRHPDTGNRVAGTQLPDWEAARSLVEAASNTLPRLTIVGWDVAFTVNGPVIVEANAKPGPQGLQVAMRRGIRPALEDAFSAAATANAGPQRVGT
jgi:hypothetical protein